MSEKDRARYAVSKLHDQRVNGLVKGIVMTTVADETLGKLARQQNDLFRRVREGSLDPERVFAGVQAIIEGNFPETIPVSRAWYVSPEQQLEKVRQLNSEYKWGFEESDFPSEIPEFTPRTSTEWLLLVVYLPDKGKVKGLQRTFNAWWDVMTAPDGFDKVRWEKLDSDPKHLRLVSGTEHQPGIRWVVIDPNANPGLSPEAALKSVTEVTSLAGVEVLALAALCPGWVTSWNGKGSPFPNMSGLQFYYNSAWSLVPCIRRWVDYRMLKLDAYWAGDASSGWASPAVRKC